MNPNDIRTLRILEEVEGERSPSQRELARKLNVSLGLVNSFIKRLAKKGYVKITTIPKNRIKYILTPKGAAEKTRLTYEYIQYSFKFYKDARQKLRDLFLTLESQGVARIVLFGASDLAEIALLSLQESQIQLIAIVDDEKKKIGKRFLKYIVRDPDHLAAISFDKIVLTTLNPKDAILQKITERGISPALVAAIH
jgi:DNA-binding MarR family transcriptional regulator